MSSLDGSSFLQKTLYFSKIFSSRVSGSSNKLMLTNATLVGGREIICGEIENQSIYLILQANNASNLIF